MRLAEVGSKLKSVKQWVGQSVGDLITHMGELEAQVPEPPGMYQEYSHLLHALHPHLRKTVLRKSSVVLPRRELEEMNPVKEPRQNKLSGTDRKIFVEESELSNGSEAFPNGHSTKRFIPWLKCIQILYGCHLLRKL